MLKKDYNRVLAAYKASVSEEVCISMLLQLITKSLKTSGYVSEDPNIRTIDISELTAEVAKWTTRFFRDIKAIRSNA